MFMLSSFSCIAHNHLKLLLVDFIPNTVSFLIFFREIMISQVNSITTALVITSTQREQSIALLVVSAGLKNHL